MSINKLVQCLHSLPNKADKVDVLVILNSALIEALGLQSKTIVTSQFLTGHGSKTVDVAVFNSSNIPKNNQPVSPYLILNYHKQEADFNLPVFYKTAVANLKQDLLAPKCKSVYWGIICNGKQIQLFRRHGKVVHPICPVQNLDVKSPEVLQEVIDTIKSYVNANPPALTVAIYNNKGGVGKTTTIINLAAILAFMNYKVLAVDFDCQQRDLTTSLGFQVVDGSLRQCLEDKKKPLKPIIVTYEKTCALSGGGTKKIKFDVIPSDKSLIKESSKDLESLISFNGLQKLLEPIKGNYDYIFIDAPPNWTFFSQSSLYAADVVLIPTQHDNVNSLGNTIPVVAEYIVEIQKAKKQYIPGAHDTAGESNPMALPIFFNGGKPTEAQLKLTRGKLDKYIMQYRKQKIELQPYFYPKSTENSQDKTIFHLPANAYIAQGSFKGEPAVFSYQPVYESYRNLAREYFIYG